MVKWENPELTSSHGSIYRATMNKNLQSNYRQEQPEDRLFPEQLSKLQLFTEQLPTRTT